MAFYSDWNKQDPGLPDSFLLRISIQEGERFSRCDVQSVPIQLTDQSRSCLLPAPSLGSFIVCNWKEVWEGRPWDSHQQSVLAQMMAADGTDSGFADMSEHVWQDFVRHSADKMGLFAGASVFEVGCGAGAYLYEFYQQGCRVGGLDFSETLLDHTQTVMPNGKWVHGEACNLDVQSRFDFVVSCGVFHYFPSLAYAHAVLERMVSKARVGVAVLDVPDREMWKDALAARRGRMGQKEYDRRYDGLDHLYYTKEWFNAAFEKLRTSRIQIHHHAGWLNSRYRFDVYAWR